MKNAIKKFPWFEVILIVGLAVALIAKPQNSALSAPPEGGQPNLAKSVLPRGL
jgi:hypothetical protein